MSTVAWTFVGGLCRMAETSFPGTWTGTTSVLALDTVALGWDQRVSRNRRSRRRDATASGRRRRPIPGDAAVAIVCVVDLTAGESDERGGVAQVGGCRLRVAAPGNPVSVVGGGVPGVPLMPRGKLLQ